MAEYNGSFHLSNFRNFDLFRLFADKFPDIIARYDPELRLIYVNPALEKLTGLTSSAMIGKTHAEVGVEAGLASHWDNILAEVFRTGESASTEFVYQGQADVRYFQTWIVPGAEPDGSVRSVFTISRDITGLKELEKALRDDDAKSTEPAENANSIILRIDAQGRITFINEFALRFLGLRAEEILGRNVVDTIVPRRDSSGEDPESCADNQNENVLRNSGRVGIASADRRSEDQNVTFSGLLPIDDDLTERKRTEAALLESEAKYRGLFEMESDAIFLVDDDTGKIIEANLAAANLYGYSREELLQLNRTDLSAEPEQTHTASLEQRIKVPVRFHKKKNGSILPVEITASRFSWKGRNVHISVIRDITEAQRSRESLEIARRQLMDIIEFLPDATFVIDREGKVIAWNRAIEEMTGVPKEKMLGMGDYAYAVPFYGERRPILIDLVMKNLDEHTGLYDFIERHDNLLSAEIFVPKAYGGRCKYLWGMASPLFDMNGNLSGTVEDIRDITEQKRIESALLKREADLEEKAHQLEEINTALKVLLRRREEDKSDLEESLLTNVKESILPFMEKLKKTRLDENQKTYLGIVESQLGEIVSPFLRRLSSRFTNLTPMEIKVAKLIQEGRTSKEIAEILLVAEQTVLTHRSNLRAKLGLRNEKINLRSHLMSLT